VPGAKTVRLDKLFAVASTRTREVRTSPLRDDE
jgi:hypothetical protein